MVGGLMQLVAYGMQDMYLVYPKLIHPNNDEYECSFKKYILRITTLPEDITSLILSYVDFEPCDNIDVIDNWIHYWKTTSIEYKKEIIHEKELQRQRQHRQQQFQKHFVSKYSNKQFKKLTRLGTRSKE